MSKNNFKFIRVKSDYINFLLRYDNKIQYNDNLLGKENKPFLGVLFNINGQNYYVPLSSANKKKKLIDMHKRYKKTNKKVIDIFFIEDKNGKLLSILNLNNMIPIAKNSIVELNIKSDKDASLLQKEFQFCNKHKRELRERAKKLYSIVKNHTNERIEKRCCNFLLLEVKCKEYEEKNLAINKTTF